LWFSPTYLIKLICGTDITMVEDWQPMVGKLEKTGWKIIDRENG
jgi:hypothetical protein